MDAVDAPQAAGVDGVVGAVHAVLGTVFRFAFSRDVQAVSRQAVTRHMDAVSGRGTILAVGRIFWVAAVLVKRGIEANCWCLRTVLGHLHAMGTKVEVGTRCL